MSHTKENIDRLLWKQLTKGDDRAFSQIYESNYQNLVTYGVKMGAEISVVKDAIQDIYINIWNKRGSLPQVNNIRFYLLKSLRNRVIRLSETDKKNQVNLVNQADHTSSPEELLILSELKQEQLLKLRFYIQHLPLHQRETIHLRFFQNLKIAEIAELMGINKQSVSNNIHRGFLALRDKFSEGKQPKHTRKFGLF